jgi:hypothetical protein
MNLEESQSPSRVWRRPDSIEIRNWRFTLTNWPHDPKMRLQVSAMYDYFLQDKVQWPLSTTDIRQLTLGSVSESTARNKFAILRKDGWVSEISQLTPEQASGIVISAFRKRPYDLTGMMCSWCHRWTPAAHHHHYPVSKKDGGDKTVRICPTCHSSFHSLLLEKRYTLSPKMIDYFKNLTQEDHECPFPAGRKVPARANSTSFGSGRRVKADV